MGARDVAGGGGAGGGDAAAAGGGGGAREQQELLDALAISAAAEAGEWQAAPHEWQAQPPPPAEAAPAYAPAPPLATAAAAGEAAAAAAAAGPRPRRRGGRVNDEKDKNEAHMPNYVKLEDLETFDTDLRGGDEGRRAQRGEEQPGARPSMHLWRLV